jgi:hypothetical protein
MDRGGRFVAAHRMRHPPAPIFLPSLKFHHRDLKPGATFAFSSPSRHAAPISLMCTSRCRSPRLCLPMVLPMTLPSVEARNSHPPLISSPTTSDLLIASLICRRKDQSLPPSACPHLVFSGHVRSFFVSED